MLRKVLHIHASAALGGTELRTYQLACRLRDSFEMSALFLCRPGPIQDLYRREGISFWTAPFLRFDSALRIIHRLKPDVIHIYGLKLNVIWRPILSMLGCRNLIGHIAGLTNAGEYPSWIRVKADLWTHRFLKTYLSNSKTVSDRLIGYGFDPSIVRVIHNGVDLPTLVPRPAHESPVIITVGNLRPVKGHRYFLDALKRLRDEGFSFQAHIVGVGPDQDILEMQCRRSALENQVRFLGQIDNQALLRLMQQSDIFALLSLSEGISGAAMEAMAAGLPVIATDVGGMSELISNGKEGYLVAPRDPDQAADRLGLLLRDSALRRHLSAQARLKIEAQFNLKDVIRRYESLYHSV